MRLSQLQQLAALSRAGSFTKAAQELFISQPALSTSMRELEEELGRQLIARSNRGIVFTPAGLSVLEYAHRILADVDEIYRICRSENLSGELKLASTPHYCVSILLDVKLKIEQSYPDIHIDLSENDSSAILQQVKSGELDAGLIQDCDLPEKELETAVNSGGVHFLELFEEKMCVAVSERHPLASRDSIAPQELLDYSYGSYKNALNRWVGALLKEHGRENQIFHINDIDPLRMLLARAQAFTVIPCRSIPYGNAIYRFKMAPLTVEGVQLSSRIGLVYKGSGEDRLTNLLIEVMEEECAQYRSSNQEQED